MSHLDEAAMQFSSRQGKKSTLGQADMPEILSIFPTRPPVRHPFNKCRMLTTPVVAHVAHQSNPPPLYALNGTMSLVRCKIVIVSLRLNPLWQQELAPCVSLCGTQQDWVWPDPGGKKEAKRLRRTPALLQKWRSLDESHLCSSRGEHPLPNWSTVGLFFALGWRTPQDDSGRSVQE
ncbi:hypothetical protein BJX96DRAFT_88315 [Aspergillus floccosus]